MEEESPVFRDPQLERQKSRDKTRDPVDLADFYLAELAGGTSSSVSKLDLQNGNHAAATLCLQGYVEDRLASLGQDKLDFSSGTDSGTGDSLEDPAEIHTGVIATPHDVITTPHDVITTPHDVITTPHDVIKAPRENVLHPQKHAPQNRPSANRVGFKTHVPGIFDKIQAKLDSSVKLIDDELQESRRPRKTSKSPETSSNSVKSPETFTRSNSALSRSSSVLSSDDPIEIADQCLAEFQSDLIAPRDVITTSRDVITPPREIEEVPPLHENIKHLPPKMTKTKSVPSMQRNARGFKTHVPGIFDKIQARLDSSVKLIDEEESTLANKSTRKFSNETETRRNKPAQISRSSSVLSSDDPIEIADQCLAEFQSDLIAPRDVITPPRDVITPPRDVITPPRDVITPPRDVITPPREFEVPPLHENIKHLPPKMTKAKSVPSMQRNTRGFKTHVPGIFDKIQARLDSSVKLIDDEVTEELYSKNRSRQKTTNFANKTEVDKVSKPALLSRSSSILSSDDPVEIADQCLAEFQDSAPSNPPRHEITPPIEVIQHSRDVITTARDVITPPRDVITPPREIEEVPPLHENIKHLPPKMTKTKSVPSMQRNARGFKTHVPGIFDKIQARLDSSVKLIDEEEMEENSRKIPRDVIEEKLKNLEPDGFQCHVPDVFNKIQEKLYFSPDVKENQENEEKQVLKT